MSKSQYHPKAFLLKTKNVKKGLATRTRIAVVLDEVPCTAKEIGEKSGLNYSSVIHHLRLMRDDHIIKRSNGKPYIWEFTGVGQKRLNDL
ncbi:MAG: winged helix-turn-helix domain-containing protein [Candidatus Bathyarchaeia archaeon]